MFNMSQNYRLRKCHFEKDVVPTQSLMRKKMSPVLADVYFKSMSPKLKVLAGLEPPLQGGGTSWYIPPEDLLQQRVVMKPFNKEYMSNLNCYGVDEIGMSLAKAHINRMRKERDQIVHDYNVQWKKKLDDACDQYRIDCSLAAAKTHTHFIRHVVQEFSTLYSTSVTKLQDVCFDAAYSLIKKSRQEMFQKMQTKYELFLRQQATRLTNKYTKKLTRKKTKLKEQFIRDLETTRNVHDRNLHDINLEKHVAIEKLRKLLECRNLANQAYVALIERQECYKQIESDIIKQAKRNKLFEKETTHRNLKIKYAFEKEKKRLKLESAWKIKVSHVLNKFHMFVSYCLKLLPEHAEFFINLEMLFMLQLNEALEFPSICSMIVMDNEPGFRTPVPQPHPFYVFCDKNYKPRIDQDLCPKHCTSSASQLPVIVINKRFIYSACDNFEQLADKLTDYIGGIWGEDEEVDVDVHDDSPVLPVRYTSVEQVSELKLESSLFQVLQQEIANARKLPLECAGCKIPHCFCSYYTSSELSVRSEERTDNSEGSKQSSLPKTQDQYDNITLSQKAKLDHKREPKMKSYSNYIKPKKCECTKIVKHDLFENLPIYMRKMSTFDAPELLNYEMCSSIQLKILVDKAKGIKPLEPKPIICETHINVATQTTDDAYDYLCTCFSDESINRFYIALADKNKIPPLTNEKSTEYLTKKTSPSAIRAAYFIDPSKAKSLKSKTNEDCICPY